MANIYDVARAARVSVATVSASVNGTAYVSPGLKARVEAWARLIRDAVRAAGGHQPFSLGDGAWGVPVTTLWYVDGATYLGTVIVRHRLTPELTRRGGHIGYHVAPVTGVRAMPPPCWQRRLPTAATPWAWPVSWLPVPSPTPPPGGLSRPTAETWRTPWTGSAASGSPSQNLTARAGDSARSCRRWVASAAALGAQIAECLRGWEPS